jgi:isochorismate synthase EntC
MKPENNTPPEEQETGGQAAPEEQETAPKKYAGKYGSVEELEKGYQNLQSMHGQTASELGGMKSQLQQLQETIAAGQQQNNQQAAQPVDYDQLRQQVLSDFNNGNIDEVTMADKLAGIQTAKLDQQYQNVLAQQEGKFTELLQQELGKRDQQAVYKDFVSQNPDFENLLADGTLSRVIDENPYVRDEYDAYQAFRASNAESQVEQAKQEAFEAGKAEALKQIGGSNPSKEVSGGAGQSVVAPTAGEDAATPGKAELFQSGLEAFRSAGQ